MDGADRSRLPSLAGHIIVAGAGRLGRQAILELIRNGRGPVVVLELREETRRRIQDELGEHITVMAGDATEDAVLEAAGVREAAGLIAALNQPRDNLFLCLSARQMNPRVRIVSRIDDSVNQEKFGRVGVDTVVNPTSLGGRRLAHAMIQPDLAALAEALIQRDDVTHFLLEVPIIKASPAAGKRLREALLQERTGCVIMGYRSRRARAFTYRPSSDTRLRAGGVILALGRRTELSRLCETLAGAEWLDQPPSVPE